MRLSKAQEQLRGLELPQKKRLSCYYKQLSTDRFNTACDGRMVEALLSIANQPKIVEEEIDYLKRIQFSQAVYEYSQIEEQLIRFTLPDVASFYRNQHYRSTKFKWMIEFSTWNLKSLDYNRNAKIEDCVPRKDAHAGFSYILTGKKEKGQYLETLHQDYHEHECKARKEGSNNRPILIMTRTQGGGQYDDEGNRTNKAKHKSRFISAIDIMQVMMEMKFAKPFQERMGRVKWYAGGKDDKAIANCIYSMRKRIKRYWKSIDYSKYDQSIPAWMIHDAFDLVKAAFKGDEYFDEELFKIVRNDFIHKVFLDPKRGCVESNKGVPSGSMFTQIIDTLCNILMIETYMRSIGVEDFEMMIMGDDNLIYVGEDIKMEALASYLKRNFGIEVNTDKFTEGTFDDPPEFLSRVWTPEGVYRDPKEMIAKLVFPERFRDYKRNPQLSPWMIIDAYQMCFPRGMIELVNPKLLQHRTADEMARLGEGKYHSGLMRYLIQYRHTFA